MNVYILSTQGIGIDAANLLWARVPLQGIIGLTRRDSTDEISGYVCMEDYCRQSGVPFIPVESYSLKSDVDERRLLGLDIDVLVVFGWQRLIPEWLIRHCKGCALGAHGSPYGITGGRGRSPQNWAIILGKREFHISIFRIDAGIDSGGVLDSRTFELTELDDIKTSYCKALLLEVEMIAECLASGRALAAPARPQTGEARYLPQRLPSDGEIDWSRSSGQVDAFIRALTRPYPGAFSRFEGGVLRVWKGRPIDVGDSSCGMRPGAVAGVLHGGDLIIRTGTGCLLVEDYSVEPETASGRLHAGRAFEPCDFKEQMKGIIARHYKKHPELPICQDILTAAGWEEPAKTPHG